MANRKLDIAQLNLEVLMKDLHEKKVSFCAFAPPKRMKETYSVICFNLKTNKLVFALKNNSGVSYRIDHCNSYSGGDFVPLARQESDMATLHLGIVLSYTLWMNQIEQILK
jgi:hypothetical protein